MTALLDRAADLERHAADDGCDIFGDMAGDPDGLRWYQREMFDAVLSELDKVRSTVVVAATGTGKTRLFAAVAKRWPGNVLFLAHRDELVTQARKEVERATGEWVEVEKAEFKSHEHTRLIVGSVQTLCKKKRLETLGADRFSLIVVDEFHHATAPSYRTILDHFPNAKVLGVTATPDRADKKALGQVAQSVAYKFTIEHGIDHGYLVPIEGRQVEINEIDLSGITKTAGDLAISQLDEVMVKAVEGVVKETIRLEPDRQAICFFPGVKSAELACARFNELAPNSAMFVWAQTDPDERRKLVRDFQKGVYRYFCNVGVATEGFDAPAVSLVVLARPTLSRALYTQMIGRGTRVLPGIIDHVEGRELSAVRRAMIARSAKQKCVVLDFVGNCGKHSLVSLVDVLGGDYTPAEIKRAKKKEREDGEANPRDLLEQAREELRAIAKMAKSTVKASVKKFDPFKVLQIDNDTASHEHTQQFGYKPLTAGQRNSLLSYGLKEKELVGMSKFDGDRFILAQKDRLARGLCSYRQLKQLQRYGITEANVPWSRAKEAMDYLTSRGWGKLGAIDPKKLNEIVYRRREPGDEG